MMMDKKIETIDDVKAFVRAIKAEGVVFHPDDNFVDYVNMATGEPRYTPEEAEKRELRLGECFVICERNGVDIYDVCLELVAEQ